MDHAQITISQEDMNSTYSADCSYTLIGTNGQPIAAGLVETEPETVLVTLPVEKMKEVELTVDLIPGGGATADNVTVDIEPRTLMVAGSAEILDQLDRISLGEIDLSKVFGTLTQSMTINLDPSLTNVSGITEAKVTVTVEGLVTKTLEAGNIEIPDIDSTTCSAMPTDLPPTSPRADEADLEVAHNAVAERPSMTYSCLFKIILIDYP